MTYENRLKQAAYVSPSGVRMSFIYENVSKEFDKKTSNFEFPDVDGTYVQDNGITGDRIPFRIYFNGDDHDLDAEKFESLLKEKGVGVLEHPLYGDLKVIPFGSITVRNDLKTASNETVFELTFYQTLEIIHPIVDEDIKTKIEDGVKNAINTNANQFSNKLNIKAMIETASIQAQYKNILDRIRTNVIDNKGFETIYDSIDSSLNVLIDDPVTLSYQTSMALVKTNLDIHSFKTMIDVFSKDIKDVNEFFITDLFLTSLIVSTVYKQVNTDFIIKSEVVESVELLNEIFENYTTWKDSHLITLSLSDSGEVYKILQALIVLTNHHLLYSYFKLKFEKKIIIDRPRCIIELLSELIPFDSSLDDHLDKFILLNNLTGDEIITIPVGREIVYHV